VRQKLFFIVNVDWFFISHRLPIAVEAVKQGYDVHIATTITDSVAVLEECGLTVHPLKLHRTRTGVVAVLAEFLELLSLIRTVAPDILHLVTIKPVLLGGIAARWVRVPAVVSAMAGLGFVFIEQKGIKAIFLRRVIKPLFRWALGHPHQTLIFQNPGDRDRVLSMARISLSQTQLIRGSGIDLSACPVLPEPEGPRA
jgi:hypothetical protein